MYRYNICHRLTTGELLYLGKQQQWVNDMTQAITLHGSGAEGQRIDEGLGTGGVLGGFLVPLRQTSGQAPTTFSVISKQSEQACDHDVSVARRA